MPAPRDEFVSLPERGLRLHYRDWGGEGPPLVLLHGLSSSARIWDWTAPRLTDRYRVIALDQRSHGLSDQADDGYGFDSVSADLAAFIEALGLERPALAGHSWGASVALVYAAERPEGVRSVGLVDGGIVELSRYSDWETAEKAMRPPEIDGTPVGRFVGFMQQWPVFKEAWNDELREMVLANFDVREDGTIARRLTIENHMKIARAIYDLRTPDLLSALKCPLLVVCCKRDAAGDGEKAWQRFRDDGLEMVARLVPAARVVVMEDTIHDVPIQRPERLAEELTFL